MNNVVGTVSRQELFLRVAHLDVSRGDYAGFIDVKLISAALAIIIDLDAVKVVDPEGHVASYKNLIGLGIALQVFFAFAYGHTYVEGTDAFTGTHIPVALLSPKGRTEQQYC